MTRLVVALLVALSLVAPRPVRAAEELLVFAAASLTNVLQEVVQAFEKTSHDRVTFSFGGSSDLARQIVAGAPADVFFSADVAQMERVVKVGAVQQGDVRELLTNSLVVIVPTNATTTIDGAGDLAKVKRLALADPKAVPAGVYTKQWLEKAGTWKATEPHVVPTVDVRAALAAVATGAADAAVVYRTDAAIEPRVRIAYAVPAADGPRIVYAVAPVQSSHKLDEAKELVDFLASPAARPAFERAGFGVLP
ncbi:MAG: molybdate ABC transporter substrate-binding protein [bacterium]|nr:molybdate ABC transporter substrate-binding protein [bacterium]